MGKLILLLLLVVGGVVGFGYYNYNRNADIEADAHLPRPYAKYETKDVEAMIKAYQQQIEAAKKRTSAEPTGAGAIDRRDSSDVGGKADAFAGFQRQNEHWKERRGEVFELEGELKKLQFEKSIRDRHLDDPVWVFKARLLTF
jgi:hypothetical protein